MKIKTFPLQFTETELNEIRKFAEKQNKSIKGFILDLIKEELKKENKENE